jgi:phosphatidylserine/phosphatidylglycerophosphate/cardiolipin synthase-like enzyme
MDTAELDYLLNQWLADRRLQSAERKSLIDWMTRHAHDDGKRAIARSRAFAAARSVVAPDQLAVLDWLEEVVKIAARPTEPGGPRLEAAAAFFSPGTACIQEVLRQFDMARQSCDICVFTVTDDRITSAILRAHGRGVKVRIITDDEKSHDLGSDVERLQAAGIPCKMDVGQPAHMHHKFALFDGKRLMSGSFNWTRSASEQNEENLIVTPDPDLVSAFAERFEMLWARMRDVRCLTFP